MMKTLAIVPVLVLANANNKGCDNSGEYVPPDVRVVEEETASGDFQITVYHEPEYWDGDMKPDAIEMIFSTYEDVDEYRKRMKYLVEILDAGAKRMSSREIYRDTDNLE